MPKQPLVLSDDEYREFTRPGRFIPRRIARQTLDGAREAPVALIDHLEAELTSLIRQSESWFRGWCIAVHDGDGAKWSAEAVADAIAERFPQFTSWALAGRPAADSLPMISRITGGRSSFLALAARHKLTTRFLTLRSGFSVLLLLAALALGFVVQIVTALHKGAAPTPDFAAAARHPGFYVLPAILAVVTVALAYVMSRLTAFTPEKSEERFLENYEASRGSREYDNLVDALVAKLRRMGFPRFVVAGKFERLDVLTRDVIASYFRHVDATARGSEFWLVLEGKDGETLSEVALNHQSAPGFRSTAFFEQRLLDEGQRRDLSRIVHGDERTAHFTTVREICKGGAGDKRLYERLTEYRRIHPTPEPPTTDSGYGPLDLLYLMSLSAEPGQYPLGRAFLESMLSTRESELRSEVLTAFLRTTRLVKHEIHGALTEVGKEFRSFVVIEGPGAKQTIRVTTESAAVLARHHGELKLAPPDLGHLFWALLWYEKRRVFEAFWIRQLAHHLLTARPSAIRDEHTYQRILEKLFEAGLFAVEGCLKTCLFRHVRDLLNATWGFLEASTFEPRAAHQRRLLRRCWEAYSVLGDEEILRLIFEIHARAAAPALPDEADEADALERLFLESVSFSGDRRLLRSRVLYPASRPPSARESIADYSRIRAGWFALTIVRLTEDSSPNSVIGAAIGEEGTLADATRAACARAEREADDRARVADLLAVSLGVWCQALAPRPVPGARRLQDIPRALALESVLDAETRALVSALGAASPEETLRAVADLAETAVLLSGKLKEEAARPSATSEGATNFLRDVLAREICAVALAAVVTAYHHLSRRRLDGADDALLRKIEATFRFASDLLEYPLPPVSKETLVARDLVHGIDELLKFCGMMWRKFDLDTLCAFNGIRRLQFRAEFFDGASAQEAALEPLFDAIGPSIHSRDFAGVIANVAIADSLTTVGVASARHLRDAATAALLGGFGERLKREMSLAAILRSHTFPSDLTPFVEAVLDVPPDGPDYLSVFLKGAPEPELAGHVLALVNTSERLARPELGVRLISTIEAIVPGIESPEIRNEVQSLLELSLLQRRLRAGQEIGAPGLLASWNDRKQLWLYPAVLTLLLEAGRAGDDARTEAVTILDRDPSEDVATTYLYLALTLLEERITGRNLFGELDAPLKYLTQSIGRWTTRLPVEANIRAYQVLHRLDVARALDHRSRLEEWQARKIREDHLTKLPALVKRGRFFLIFREYVRSMSHWGLRTEVPAREVADRLGYDAERRRQLLDEWRKSGAPPRGFTRDAGAKVLSAEFLCLGEYLFTPPLDVNPGFDAQREDFDRAADNDLPALLDMIGELPELPATIREVFQRHSRRLLEYTPAA